MNSPFAVFARARAVFLFCAFPFAAHHASAQPRSVQPVLGFPEAGIDDPAAYQGYQTRFYRDTRGNVVQIYLDTKSGRVVNLLADAVNESVGFTVRDEGGRPVRLDWGSAAAVISEAGGLRTIEYQLVASAQRIQIGWVLLGSMRVERDLQYSNRHLQPFAEPTFRLREQEDLIANIERLDSLERDRHLRLMSAGNPADLRARLTPEVTTRMGGGVGGSARVASISQLSLDGKTSLRLELGKGDQSDAAVTVTYPTISIRSRDARPLRFTVRVTTDAGSLTPLAREQIFNAGFLRFLANARDASNRITRSGTAATRSAADSAAVSWYRQLERDTRGVELLSSREKLMAGLPNYATYFGRDMMMTALMMESVWDPTMAEHVIASVLRKLGPNGDVSHEEALGGQAIRENAVEYNALIADWATAAQRGNRQAAAAALFRARAVLGDLQKVRENYNMLDDEFQLPLVAARYLANTAIPAARKRAFLMDSSDGRGPRVGLLLKELALVATIAQPYARNPIVQNLVGSPRQDATHWRSVSWRDSGAGYANGRFAMDINAIWVPRALASIPDILGALQMLGLTRERIPAVARALGQSALADYASNPATLERAIQAWTGAEKHFVVSLSADEVGAALRRKLASLPAAERRYWESVLSATGDDGRPLEFLAVSLDESGRPIPVVNTDPATWLFLEERTEATAAAQQQRAARDLRAALRPFPVGLLIGRLGPVVANDAYASPAVWEAFSRDLYHSPRVVWGREVNLLVLGLAKQIAALDADARRTGAAASPQSAEMRDALRRIVAAVDASGLKHNELWSYEIAGGRLRPIRYGASTDIQLWNVTDLAVQFVLAKMKLP